MLTVDHEWPFPFVLKPVWPNAGPILERKGMYTIFQRKGKKGQNIWKFGQKWTKFENFWKRAASCDYCTHETARICPAMIPCFDMATQAVHLMEWNGLCWQSSGGVEPQKILFFEFTWPERRKWASSKNPKSSR